MMMIVYQASRKARRSLFDRVEWSRSCYAILRSLEKVGVRVQISGLDHVQEVDGPCIFVCNHMSTLETFVLPALLLPHKDITFIIKRSLVKYPVFRHVMSATRPIVIDRVNPRNDLVTVLREGTALINAGKSIVVFPQTTRTARFEPGEFNSLGIKLAKRCGAPVIPVALKTDAWGCGKILKDFGMIDPSRNVYFEFGRQIDVMGRGDREHERVTHFISDHLNEWKQSGER